MGKIVRLDPWPGGGDWYGALLDDEGREIPITEAMVRRALRELDDSLGEHPAPYED